jgi:hypothetical protein
MDRQSGTCEAKNKNRWAAHDRVRERATLPLHSQAGLRNVMTDIAVSERYLLQLYCDRAPVGKRALIHFAT